MCVQFVKIHLAAQLYSCVLLYICYISIKSLLEKNNLQKYKFQVRIKLVPETLSLSCTVHFFCNCVKAELILPSNSPTPSPTDTAQPLIKMVLQSHDLDRDFQHIRENCPNQLHFTLTLTLVRYFSSLKRQQVHFLLRLEEWTWLSGEERTKPLLKRTPNQDNTILQIGARMFPCFHLSHLEPP